MPPLPSKFSKPSPWSNATVKVALDSGKVEKIQGKVLGNLTVYLMADVVNGSEVSLYSLGHVPSNHRIVTFKSEADALRCGEYLWNYHCMTFRETDVDEVRSRCKPWMVTWLKAMHRKSWLDPQSFKDGSEAPSKGATE